MNGFLRSFGYAFKGIGFAFKQRNFKIQLLCAILVLALGFYFQITSIEWGIILFCIALVLSLEVCNSAIEHFVDIVSPDFHETAGKIKDLAAASVLIAAIVSAVVGVIIFWTYVFY